MNSSNSRLFLLELELTDLIKIIQTTNASPIKNTALLPGVPKASIIRKKLTNHAMINFITVFIL